MMIHTEQDALIVNYWMLLLVGVASGGVYSLLVLAGLALKLFQSRATLCVSLALSGLISLPMTWLLMSQWKELPYHWDRSGASAVAFVLNLALLVFVWGAPSCQYGLSGRKTRNEIEASGDEREE